MSGTITKKQLCALYGFSSDHLRRLLNIKYFEQLQKVGYEKKSNILPPEVLRTFLAIYGAPISDRDFCDELQDAPAKN